MSKDMIVTVRVDDLQKLLDTIERAKCPLVVFSQEYRVLVSRVFTCIDDELGNAVNLIEIMMHP
jgi:hypothetical protein